MNSLTHGRGDDPASAVGESLPALLPRDDHNLRLEQNVHPPTWVNPTPNGRYNLVVVGAGTAGLIAAAGAAGLGAKVALVERALLGGDCLNVGCVPSKALIRSARAAADARDAGRFGVVVPGEIRVDFPAVMERMRRLRADISPHDSAQRFRDLGIDVFLGSGRFVAKDRLEVAGTTLQFARAVIATGARAAVPPIPGLAEAGFLTNETVFSLTELPKRLAVIGAGPIGCELAQSFARFGSEVTLIDSADRILHREDEAASRIVTDAFGRDGVRTLLGSRIVKVEPGDAGKTLFVDIAGATQEVVADAILVGAGRAPNVDGLGLDAAGVTYDARAGVQVDDGLRTSNKRIFAAGDICSRFKFTHTADAMSRIVLRNALFLGRAKMSDLTIPWCTFTDPEVAHVGMTPHDAQAAGLALDTLTVKLADVDRALLDGETDGFLLVHVRKGTDRILGATLVSRHAGETISEVTLAIVGRLGLGTLANTIHPYPTQADILKRAGDAWNRTRLTPRKQAILRWVLARRR